MAKTKIKWLIGVAVVLVAFAPVGAPELYKGSLPRLPNPRPLPLPDVGPFTRGEAAKLIVERAQYPLIENPTTQTFTDVPPTHRYYRYVESAARAGVMIGRGTGIFSPDDQIDKTQFVVLATYAFGINNLHALPGAPVLGNRQEIPAWATRGVDNAYRFGGFEMRFDSPHSFVTREYATALMNRLRNTVLTAKRGLVAFYLSEKLDLPIVKSCPGVPSDVGASPYCPEIKSIIDAGYMSLRSPQNIFAPDEAVSRAVVAHLAARALRDRNILPAFTSDGRSTFPDVPVNSWFYEAVESLARAGYNIGYPDGTFRPSEPANLWLVRDLLENL